jgi:hypothetical protein
MEIFHEVSFSSDDQVEAILDALGIRYRKSEFFEKYTIRFEVAESDPRWERIRDLMAEKGKYDYAFDTAFTDEEILKAPWLRVFGLPQIGYPQPEKLWLAESPNYADWCRQCGSFRQVSSFFIKKEPKMQRWDFMSLFWTSAVFAVPRVFAALEANGIQGYERWPVYIYKNKEPSTKVAQLYLPHVTQQPALIHADDLEPFVCEACGALKYKRYHKRGVMYLRKEVIPSGVDFFQTLEWFGEGYQPRREVIVANRVAQLAYAEKWRGVAFKVVELA